MYLFIHLYKLREHAFRDYVEQRGGSFADTLQISRY